MTHDIEPDHRKWPPVCIHCGQTKKFHTLRFLQCPGATTYWEPADKAPVEEVTTDVD